MPYKKIEQLPKPIQHVLPKRAQTLFMKAFNVAHFEYKNEVIAFKVAWGAVKKKYKKNEKGKWVKKT
ncbi:ChaB family protein [Candidatus Woesearchaeota archaeon]|nr:ChaB family protein [Candidatus Woesearchaeota archaeon]